MPAVSRYLHSGAFNEARETVDCSYEQDPQFNEVFCTVWAKKDDPNKMGDMEGGNLFQCEVNTDFHEYHPAIHGENKCAVQCYAQQHELCPDTGRLHMHLYIQFVQGLKVKRSDIINKYLIGNFGHVWTKRRAPKSSPQRAFAYCIKKDSRHPQSTPKIFGAPFDKRDPERNEAEQILDLIHDGEKFDAVQEQHAAFVATHLSWVKENLVLEGYKRAQLAGQRTQHVHIYWGSSRTGKTQKAWYEGLKFAMENNKRCYFYQGLNKWWDNYDDEEVIILDEVSPKVLEDLHLHEAKILRLWDGTPAVVEVKNGGRALMATHWYVSSNMKWENWYPMIEPEHEAALRNRILVNEEMTGEAHGEQAQYWRRKKEEALKQYNDMFIKRKNGLKLLTFATQKSISDEIWNRIQCEEEHREKINNIGDDQAYPIENTPRRPDLARVTQELFDRMQCETERRPPDVTTPFVADLFSELDETQSFLSDAMSSASCMSSDSSRKRFKRYC